MLRSRGLRLVLLAATLLAAAACSSDEPAPSSSPTAGSTEAAAATQTPSPTETELQVESSPVPLELPRSVIYGNVELGLQAAVRSNATPGTYLDDEAVPGEDHYLYIELAAQPELQDPFGEIHTSWFTLVLADGTTVPAEDVDFVSRAFVEAGVAVPVHLAFPIGVGTSLDGASLSVAEPTRVPAVLPLSGPVPEEDYPVAIEVEGSGTVSFEGGCGNATGDFEVTGAELDLDAGADHTGDSLEPNQSKRSAEGERWLRVAVDVVAIEGTCGGTIASDSAFRLFVDDLPSAALNRDAELLDNGVGTSFVWGWIVPIDADLLLEVGVPDGETVQVPIELPATLP
ncbi:MAG: hypothetical protein R3320_09495 [Nitriliruptorales bacterium]|nr:hypothetical protein [Nitriliruptorales bacterium]